MTTTHNKKTTTKFKYFGWFFVTFVILAVIFLYFSIRGLDPVIFNAENIDSIVIANEATSKTIKSKEKISEITKLLRSSKKTDTYKAKIHTRHRDIFFYLKGNKIENVRVLYTVEYGILFQSNSFVYKNDAFVQKIDTD